MRGTENESISTCYCTHGFKAALPFCSNVTTRFSFKPLSWIPSFDGFPFWEVVLLIGEGDRYL